MCASSLLLCPKLMLLAMIVVTAESGRSYPPFGIHKLHRVGKKLDRGTSDTFEVVNRAYYPSFGIHTRVGKRFDEDAVEILRGVKRFPVIIRNGRSPLTNIVIPEQKQTEPEFSKWVLQKLVPQEQINNWNSIASVPQEPDIAYYEESNETPGISEQGDIDGPTHSNCSDGN